MHIWVITDNKAGNKTQARALADAIQTVFAQKSAKKSKKTTQKTTIEIHDKTIECSLPWRYLPLSLWGKATLGTRDTTIIPKTTDDFPDMIISCGRQGAGVARCLRRMGILFRGVENKRPPFAVHIQNPRTPRQDFDIIVAPAHDNFTGDNVLLSNGAISRFNRQNLDTVKRKTAKQYAHLPRPIIAVSLGGENKAYTITPDWINQTAQSLLDISDKTGGSLLISPSRRTGADNTQQLATALADINGVFWDGTGNNPYEEFLAHADMHIVTCESVNMISDCIMTERPVYILDLPEKTTLFNKSKKFKSYVNTVINKQLAFPFKSDIVLKNQKKTFKCENETLSLAQQIVRAFEAK